MAHDDIFRELREPGEPFRFDARVADVFDDMIHRSLPGYAALIDLLGVAARQFSRDGSTIYDLGCSLGTGTLAMRRALGARPVNIVAVDQSAAMVDRCRRMIARDASRAPVVVQCADAAQVPLDDASVVVMNFTLQFISHAARLGLVQRIFDSLGEGGVFVLSEKLHFDDAEQARLFEGLHDAFRRENGYSELEISQKRDALEHVLRCDTEEQHRARLAAAGFGRVELWFKAVNFASWLAFK
jgi:tRNA (cmo5U34)-methyltransferase